MNTLCESEAILRKKKIHKHYTEIERDRVIKQKKERKKKWNGFWWAFFFSTLIGINVMTNECLFSESFLLFSHVQIKILAEN